MNANKINPKYYFFNYPFKTGAILNEGEENLASTIPSQKLIVPGKFGEKLQIQPTNLLFYAR